MKLWLDDKIAPSKGWVWVKTPKEATILLETGKVSIVSLDYDLGPCIFTGYDLLRWIEVRLALENFKLPKLHVHSKENKKKLMEKIKEIEQWKKGFHG